MHLQSTILPPRHVLDEVVAAVHIACRQAQTIAEEPIQRPQQALPRLRRRARKADPANWPPPQLDLFPVEALALPVAGFGNVTTSDSARITAALKSAAAEIARPTVHFAGGAALEFDGDRQVWVRLAGDVDALKDAVRGINQAVEQLGFYVDRRKFRPLLAVGTVNAATTVPYLQGFIDALDAFSGLPWELDHVHLMRLSFETGQQPQEVDRLPLHR